MDQDDFTYILYLTQDNKKDEYDDGEEEEEEEEEEDCDTIYLGSSKDPVKLFTNGLNYENVDINKRCIIMKWLFLVEANLDKTEKEDLEYAFKHNPLNQFSYRIKDMTLRIKKIKNF